VKRGWLVNLQNKWRHMEAYSWENHRTKSWFAIPESHVLLPLGINQ
jgi:hypothetical protein